MTAPFKTVPIGGGGYICNISISNDGVTKLCRADTYGAYKKNLVTGLWDQLVTEQRGFSGTFLDGVYEIAVAPTNANIIALYWTDGNVWRSTDGGATFTKLSNWVTSAVSSNGGGLSFVRNRLYGPKIVFHPSDPDTLYIGTINNGVRFCSNFTKASPTFTSCTGITAASAATDYALAYAQDGSKVFVNSFGQGMFSASGGTSSFSAMTAGGVTSAAHIATDSSGNLWGCDESSTLYKWNGTSWSTIGSGTHGLPTILAIAPDPNVTNRIVLYGDGGYVAVSLNSGSTWPTTGLHGSRVASGIQPTWVANDIGTSEVFMSGSNIVPDPSQNNMFWLGEGIGPWVGSPTNNNSAFNWNASMAGIEQIPVNDIIAPLNNSTPTVFGWDRPAFFIADFNSYPSAVVPSYNTASIVAAWAGDYASSNGTTMLGLMYSAFGSYIDVSGISSDGGVTWTKFSNSPLQVSVIASAQSTSSTNVLTFASVPANVKQGMIAWSNANNQPFNTGGSPPLRVVSKTSTTVTLSGNLLSTVGIGDSVLFNQEQGGCCAMASPSSMIILPGNGSPFPLRSEDSGVTWSQVIVPGVPQWGTCTTTNGSNTISNLSFDATVYLQSGDTFYVYDESVGGPFAKVTVNSILSASSFTYTGTAASSGGNNKLILFETGWPDAYFNPIHSVAADRVNIGDYFLYNRLRGKIYKSTGGGVFSAVNTTPANIATTYNVQGGAGLRLRCAPDNAGHLYLTGGVNLGAFIRSTDGGVTWAQVPNVSNVLAFGFGKKKPGGNGYPAIFVKGIVNSTEGYFQCDNGEQTTPTWAQLSNKNGGLGWLSAASPSVIDGDKNIYSQFYIGLGSGSGAQMVVGANFTALRIKA